MQSEASKLSQAKYRAKNLEKRRAATREYMARQRLENPEIAKAVNRKYRQANADKVNTWNRASYARNAEVRCARAAEYKRENIEKARAWVAAWAKANPEKAKDRQQKYRTSTKGKVKHCARVAKRNAHKKMATPKWANEKAILAIYALAAELTETTGYPWEVDHFYPLISPIVCGLHCEANLQPLPAFLNRSKKNTFWEDLA